MADGLVRQVGEQAKRGAIVHPPIGRQQAVGSRVRLAEGCACEPWDDLLPADFQQVSHQCQPLPRRRRIALIPVKHGGVAG